MRALVYSPFPGGAVSTGAVAPTEVTLINASGETLPKVCDICSLDKPIVFYCLTGKESSASYGLGCGRLQLLQPEPATVYY